MTDAEVLEKAIGREGRINSSLYRYLDTKPEYAEMKEYLLHRYNDIPSELFSYKEVIWRIRNGIEIRPVCKICGAPVKFKGKSIGGKFLNGFYSTCGYEHQRLLSKHSNKETCMERYGISTTLNLPEIRAKAQEAIKSSDAVKRYTERRHMRGVLYKEVQALLANNINPKDFYKTESDYEAAIHAYNETQNILDKNHRTLQRNNTFSSSIPENILYSLLKSNFKEVLRNYKEPRYNYHCDFYIPKYDLFIEYQGSLYHNKHPFNSKSESDLKILASISESAKVLSKLDNRYTRYDAVIDTWTVRDVMKRNEAKNNKLNYLEIFSLFSLTHVPEFICNNFSGKTDTQIVIGADVFPDC